MKRKLRIAVATDDGKTMRFGHFGDALEYHIFDYEDGRLTFVETRKNLLTDEALGIEEHDNPMKARMMREQLSDCDVFVGHSMGLKNRRKLEEMGVKMIPLVKKGLSIEEALKRALEKLGLI